MSENTIPLSSLLRSSLTIPMPPVKPAPRAHFTSPFALGDKVHIDDDRDLIGCVTGHLWKHDNGACISVSWMANGEAKSEWIEAWRLVRLVP